VLTLPVWWARPGSPGWTPDAIVSQGQPWVFAGLAAGSFEMHDPFAASGLPEPGVPEAQAPLAWYDSATVVVGEGAAWRGFGAALACGQGFISIPAGTKPRSVWTAVTGSAAIDQNGLYIARGDERSWLRGGAIAGSRGAIGSLDLEGSHLWAVTGGMKRGVHAFEGSFAQRGVGERQTVGFGESGRGVSGAVKWAWSDGAHGVSARLARGRDERASTGVGGVYIPELRREAQANTAETEAWVKRGQQEWGARAELRGQSAVNAYSPGEFRREWNDHAFWAAARHARPLGPGRLELQLGGGRTSAPARSEERLQLAPGAAWRFASGGRSLRLYAERTVNPVWSDLVDGVPAFVQDTWVGGAEGGAEAPGGWLRLHVFGGTTGNRAVLMRYPVRAMSYRVDNQWGWERDASRYTFGLAQSEAGVRWHALGAEATGFVLARDGDVLQGRVDPSVGATGALTAQFRLFTNDLGVRMRSEVAWVGPRFSDGRGGIYFADRTIDGYATVSAWLELTLGDAIIALRGDNLQDVRHEQTWLDVATYPDYQLALGAGQTFRFELVWPFFN
jgi:hypothetical protein